MANNTFLNSLKKETNYTLTENGAVTHKSTLNDLYDMFALGAAMRNRSNEDILLMWRKAYEYDPVYALKCLFYIRDVRGGQGERRFFRICIKDLANRDPDAMKRNLKYIPEFGRYDDLYSLVGTPLEDEMFSLIKKQLALDLQCNTPSLLAKWLKSENTSSKNSRYLANKTRIYLNMTHKEYRKVLSTLRERINVLERLMSANRWDEIEFDKIPSKAGLVYRNAFARRDILKEKYRKFALDDSTKVNAKTLYPYECVAEALKLFRTGFYRTMRELPALDDTQRLMVNKYWENLDSYFNGASFNGIAVVDTSGSMVRSDASAPINVAISLGLYCAEKAKGPFAGHYISFASRPQLIETKGVDFVDKVQRIYKTNLVDNTNIKGVFDLLLDTARRNNCSQDEIPQNIIIISDLEFDDCASPDYWGRGSFPAFNRANAETLLEGIADEWTRAGYQMPKLIFWDVDARQNNIPMLSNGPISYVSGFSPSIFETIMSGKTGIDLMYEKLDSEKYSCIK